MCLSISSPQHPPQSWCHDHQFWSWVSVDFYQGTVNAISHSIWMFTVHLRDPITCLYSLPTTSIATSIEDMIVYYHYLWWLQHWTFWQWYIRVTAELCCQVNPYRRWWHFSATNAMQKSDWYSPSCHVCSKIHQEHKHHWSHLPVWAVLCPLPLA